MLVEFTAAKTNSYVPQNDRNRISAMTLLSTFPRGSMRAEPPPPRYSRLRQAFV